jgi:hypothetical protein
VHLNDDPGAVVIVIVLLLDLQLPIQSAPITTNVVRSNPAHGSVQHYVIKFINDLRQVSGFSPVSPQVIKFTSCLPMVGGSLLVLRLLPPLKLVAMT